MRISHHEPRCRRLSRVSHAMTSEHADPEVIFMTSYPDDPDGPTTGPQRVMRSVAHALDAKGVVVEVWSSPYRRPPVETRRLTDRGVCVRFGSPLALMRAAFRHPDAALHIGSFSMFHVAPLVARRILRWFRPVGRIVYTAHGILAVEAQLGYRVVPFLTNLAERVLLKGSDSVVVLSSQMDEMVRSLYGIDASAVTIIPPAVPPEFIATDVPPEPDRDTAPFFLYAGGLRRVKSLDTLVDAARRLHRLDPDRPWSVVAVGDVQSTWERPEGWDDLVDADRLSRLGSVSTAELSHLYESATALILPSTYEPYGMVVLETMASATPAVVSERVGARDLIEDGISGWIVAVGDDVGFMRAMLWMLDNPDQRTNMGLAARDSAMHRTPASVAGQHLKLYRDAQ